MSECVFCQIAAGKLPANKVYEDEHAIAFMDINPVAVGHTLVIPKAHHMNIFEMPPELLGHVMAAAKKVASAIMEGLKPEGLIVLQLNGAAAGQVVMHYHVHLIPRSTGDGVRLINWEVKGASAEELAELAEKIRSAL